MATTYRTVRQLAQAANIDVEDALITLWGNGFNEIKTPEDKIWPKDLKRARRTIGLVRHQDPKTTPSYWMKLFNIDYSEFKALLQMLDVPLKGKTKLQSKAIHKLKAEVRIRGIDHNPGIASNLSDKVEVSDSDKEDIRNETSMIVEASIIEEPAVRERVSVGNETREMLDFIWKTPGHRRELRWLSVDEVRQIHFALVDDFSSTADQIIPPGVRSEGLLSSAVHRPQTALGSTLKYPTVETSAAALLHSIILDHPFHNGNKRTSLVSVLVFLDENGFFPNFDQDEVFKLLLQIAQHSIVDSPQSYLADREVLAIADWFMGKCRFVEKGERPLSFHKLRQILVSYDCIVSHATAGKVSISRGVVEPRSWSGIIFGPKKKRLQTQISFAGEGREVPMNTIKKIRKELYLDELHSIDSHAFYSKEPPIQLPEFIARYRKTLDRLAKF